MRSDRRHAAWLVLAVALACTDRDFASDDESGSSGAAEADSDSPFPTACNPGESPFLSEDCFAALRDACLAHDVETACAAQPSFEFDGYDVRCGWANVLTFADDTSCAVTSELRRCEATMALWDGSATPCTAIPVELEIIEVGGGLVGPWSAIDSEPDDVFPCAPNIQPPAPLCDCAPARCDVE